MEGSASVRRLHEAPPRRVAPGSSAWRAVTWLLLLTTALESGRAHRGLAPSQSCAPPAAVAPSGLARPALPGLAGCGALWAVRAARGGSGSSSSSDSDAEDNGGAAHGASEFAGFAEADKTMAKAEGLYKSAVTGRRGKPASRTGDGSWSSCLKAVTNLIFTGSVSGADPSAKRDAVLEEAAELFAAAAVQFKLQRKMKEAGRALVRSGDSYSRHSELAFQGPAQYSEAAKVLRQQHPADAIIALGRAADMSVKCAGACNLQRAGRLRRDQADLYEAARNSTAAIAALEQAMELFEADGGSGAAAACRLRIAELRAMRGDLVVARQLFEELVADAFNAPTKAAGGMPCYLLRFRVGLCYLADGRPEQLEAALEKYVEDDLSFQDSEVYTRLRAFMEALLSSDVDAFNKIVRGMGDSAGTDKVVTSLLLTTKKAVTRQSEAGERVAQSLAAQDDDDLL